MGTTTSIRQLGVFVDQKAALEAYAKSLGTTRGALTDTERATAFNIATLNELRGVIAAAGPQAADFGEIIAGWGTFLGNAKDRFAELISVSPVLMAGLQNLSDVMRRAFGGDQEDLIIKIVRGIERGAIMLLQFGKTALTAAGSIHRAFSVMKVQFFSVTTALTELVATVAEAQTFMLDLAAKMPKVGRSFDVARFAARRQAGDLRALNVTAAETLLAAIEAAKGEGEFAAKIQASKGALSALIAAM